MKKEVITVSLPLEEGKSFLVEVVTPTKTQEFQGNECEITFPRSQMEELLKRLQRALEE